MGLIRSAIPAWVRRILYRLRPNAYWNRRHLAHGHQLDGIGNIGLGQEANALDYEEKWNQLQNLLGSLNLPLDSRAIDAGCGTGWFTERLAATGYQTHGVDFSEAAIGLARARLGSDATFEVTPLEDLTTRAQADFVICIDVLFHIVDDRSWRNTLRALADITSNPGVLIIQEHLVDAETSHKSAHVRWRTLAAYQQALRDWTLIQHRHYRLPQSRQTKDLMAWRRKVQPDRARP